MSKMKWDQTGERLYETGVKQGALYPQGPDGEYKTGVPWNGLISVSESPSGAEPTALWADDTKYLTLMSIEEFGATIEAYTYPDEFAECDGSAEIEDGVFIGQQSRKPFGLVYKTTLGNDTEGNDYGYKLHIIYGALASPSEKNYQSINESPEANTFSWEVTTTPVEVTGFKPTSQVVINSKKVDPAALKLIEDALYGNASQEPTLLLPDEIKTLLSTKYKISFVAALGKEPLTGATISVFADSARSIPVADYSSVYPGTYYYTITKELFEPFTGSIVITDSDEEIEVALVKEDID
jgi:hypothetical protein